MIAQEIIPDVSLDASLLRTRNVFVLTSFWKEQQKRPKTTMISCAI